MKKNNEDQPQLVLTKNLFATHAKEIEKVLQRAVRHALWVHKRLGNSIAVWEDGKVRIIPPEEIDVPDDDPEKG
jgi:hypothetical protein